MPKAVEYLQTAAVTDQQTTNQVSPIISPGMLRLHQVTHIFGIHARSVLGANLTAKVGLERVFLIGSLWVGI